MLKRKFDKTDLPWLLAQIEADPDDPNEYYKKVCPIYNSCGDYEASLAVSQARISRFPDRKGGYVTTLATVVALGEKQKAQALVQQILRIAPNYEYAKNILREFETRSLQGRINVSIKNKKWDDALEAMSTLIQIDPNDPRNHQQKITLLKDLGRQDDALKAIDILIQIQPNHPRNHQQRITLLKNLGRWDDAIAEIKNLIDLQLKLKEFDYLHINWRHLAALQCDVGDFNKALTAVDMAIRFSPNSDCKNRLKTFKQHIQDVRDTPHLSFAEEDNSATQPYGVDQNTGEEFVCD